MKKQLLISGYIMFASAALAQKKIEIKPSTVIPPTGFNQIAFANGFSNPNAATADLFGKAGKSDFSIPTNYMGNQDAVEGDIYFGIMTYKGDKYLDLSSIGNDGISVGKSNGYKYSEYVQAVIPTGLTAGKDYEMTFKISLADYSAFATKGFGVYFSDKQLSESGNQMLTVTPQVSFSELVKDKSTWTEMKAKYTATGNEKFAIIGCFSTNYSVENVGGGKSFGSVRSYYYISSIAIVEAPKPDRDKDGIIDELDTCPDVAGVEMFKGCPDSDGDGVADKDDACPTVKGLANFAGCPDSDNDGVADNKDNCPEIAGLVSNNGCPEVKISEKAKDVFQRAMAGIQFETGKDVIKKTSYPILDNVVSVLKENPSWNVEVQGHTDNQGDATKNKTLSEKRAIAVKNYLIAKGVANNLKPMGFGIEKPIADNKTPTGRSKNRRVEFNVSYEK